jgi:hypothetical protein
MNAVYLLGAIHLIGLAVLTALTVRRLFTGAAPRICGAFLLIWANLAYTALLLSLFSELGNRWLYLSSSLLLALASWQVVSRFVSKPLTMIDGASRFCNSRAQRFFAAFLFATLCAAATCTLIICVRYYPDNWDSLAYRLPRAVFYLSHGNLLQFSKASDPRALSYPFNNTLLYLFPAIYQLDGRIVNLVSLVCWGMSALGVYLLARVAGASKLSGFLAAWLCAMAPIVLCEGASTNDDMMAAVPMVLGSVFAYHALQHWSRRSVILAGLGFGLGLGTKLLWAFFCPLAALVAVWMCAYALWKGGVREGYGIWRPRLRVLLVTAGIAAPLAVSFLVSNYLSTGQFVSSALEGDLNRPFRLDVARQQIWLLSSQLLLSPIPDVPIHLDPDARRRAYDEFDAWTNQHWFQNVNQGEAFRAYTYKFRGIADPTGYWYFEQTLWLGFLPPLMLLLLAGAGGIPSLSTKVSVFFLAFAVWHLSFAAMSKYMETVCAYYSYPAVMTCAGFGLAWDALQRRPQIVRKLLIGAIGAVVLAHLAIDFNLLAFNVQRNVPAALHRVFDGETAVTRVAEPAVRAIRSANFIHIPYLHWELLYWNYMRHNPGAIYTTGSDLRSADSRALDLLSVANDGPFLIGRSPDSGSARMTYLGVSANDYLFGRGAGVELENPSSNHYFLIRGEASRKPADHSISGFTLNTNTIEGIESDPALEFRVASNSPSGRHWASPWLTQQRGIQVVVTPSDEKWTDLILETRWISNPSSVCGINQTNYPFSTRLYEEPSITNVSLSRPKAGVR